MCRWSAVLHSELLSSRNKCAKYRSEMHRLQRVHSTVSKRVFTAETSAAEQKALVDKLQEELTTLLTSTRSKTTSPISSQTLSSHTPPKVLEVISPSLTPRLSVTDKVGVNTCLRFIELTTPEVDKVCGSSEFETNKASLITKLCWLSCVKCFFYLLIIVHCQVFFIYQ